MMKKMMMMMLASAILMFAGCAEAQTGDGIKFTEDTFANVQKEAQKEDKLIFMDIYTTWCPPCIALSKNIFPTKIVGDYMNATFVNSKFDAEKGEGVEIAKKYKIKNYPTLLILNSKGEELARIVGGSRTPKAFVERVKDEVANIKK